MKDSKVERTRQQPMMFGRQFLQGDGGVFDQALGADATAAAVSARTRGCRERIYTPVARWPRPPKPKAMSADEYARYPEFITMREVEVNGRSLVTTLLDPKIATGALTSLYKMRWNIEVDFRTIKATLEMDVLRCKSQPMIKKEIAVYFLAYNLVRWAMAKAALLADVLPRLLSFTGTKRLLSAFADQLAEHRAMKCAP